MSTTTLSRAARLTLRWVRFYTRGLDDFSQDSRRNEIASDLWEHASHDALHSIPRSHTTASVLGRLGVGIPSDLSWRRQRRHANLSLTTRGTAMATSKAWQFTRALIILQGSLLALAGLAVIFGYLGDSIEEPYDLNVGLFFVGHALAAWIGLYLRRRHPLVSLLVISLSSFWISLMAWFSVFLLTGLLTIIMTIATIRWDTIEGKGWSSHDALRRLRDEAASS